MPDSPTLNDSDAGSATAPPGDNNSTVSNPDGRVQSDPTAQDSQENAYSEDTSQVFSQQVFEIIDEVQKRFLEGQWMEGANELNALYEDYDTLNAFEKATVLDFIPTCYWPTTCYRRPWMHSRQSWKLKP